LACLELAALAEEFDSFKAFKNAALGFDGAFAFETGMLAHKKWVNRMIGRFRKINRNLGRLGFL
jgi:hypothetical protein